MRQPLLSLGCIDRCKKLGSQTPCVWSDGNIKNLDLRFEDSPISTLSDEVLKLVWWSKFASPTGPLIGCILLSFDLAFQEHLVRSDPLSTRSSNIEIACASSPRHVGMDAPWLRVVKSLGNSWGIYPAAHLVDVWIVSAVIWRRIRSLKAWASFPKKLTDFGVTRRSCSSPML